MYKRGDTSRSARSVNTDNARIFQSKVLAFSLDTIHIPFTDQLRQLDKSTLENVAKKDSGSSTSSRSTEVDSLDSVDAGLPRLSAIDGVTSTKIEDERKATKSSYGLNLADFSMLSITSEKVDFTYPKYYLPLILEECRAVIAQSLEAITRNAIPPSLMEPVNDERSFLLKGSLSLDILGGAYTHIAVLLKSPNGEQLLALGFIKSAIKNEVIIDVIANEFPVIENDSSETEPKFWEMWILSSLVSHVRMYQACLSNSFKSRYLKPLFLSSFLTQKSPSYPTYFSALSAGKISPLLSEAETEKFKEYADNIARIHHLNDSQSLALKHFLALKDGIQLLQGPPGTGKTTTIVAMAVALVKKEKRLMICAPSNKAVQVIAKRVLASLPNTCLALAGISKKLDPALRTIFIHSWRNDRLTEAKDILKNLANCVLNLESYRKVGHRHFIGDLIQALTNINQQIIDWMGNVNKFYSTEIGSCDFQTQIKNILGILTEHNISIAQYFQAESIEQNANEFPSLSKANHKHQGTLNSNTEVNSELQSSTNRYIDEYNNEINYIWLTLKKFLKILENQNDVEVEEKLLKTAQIIFSTLAVSGRPVFSDICANNIDALIIDEAGQAVEPEALIALQHQPKKVLLVGDVNQLPATVISTHVQDYHYDWSMLQRLQVEHQQPYIMLETQYRMESAIREWPSKQYYNNLLKDGENISTRQKPSFATDRFISGYHVVNIDGNEEEFGKSFINLSEANAVYNIISYLTQNSLVDNETTIGVISFYMGQVIELNRKLTPFNHNVKLTVSTVDGFQGEECDIIIISAVRANTKGIIGFTDDYRRLNVAITRPRFSLIVLCNAATFTKRPSELNDLIQDAKTREGVYQMQETFLPTQDFRDSTSSSSLSSPTLSVGWGRGQNAMWPRSATARPSEPSVRFHKVAGGKERWSAPQCKFFKPNNPNSCRRGNQCKFTHTSPTV